MDINDADLRGSTALHWACFARSEFALSYTLSMNPDLEIKDKAGNTALHLAVKSIPQIRSTRPVRALLLRGADRAARNNKDESCLDMARGADDMPEYQLNELESMLQPPRYLECMLPRFFSL